MTRTFTAQLPPWPGLLWSMGVLVLDCPAADNEDRSGGTDGLV